MDWSLIVAFTESARFRDPTRQAMGSESLLQLLLFSSLLLGCFNLVGQFVFRAGREVLNVVVQIVGRWQSLSADCRLTTAEEGT